MKKMILFSFSLAAAALLLTGCVSVESVKDADLNSQSISLSGQPVAHINVQNWGIYLFSLPLFTGSTNSVGSVAVFRDTVNVPSVLPVLTGTARDLNATKTLDITSQYSNTGFIFYSRSINVSANAVK